MQEEETKDLEKKTICVSCGEPRVESEFKTWGRGKKSYPSYAKRYRRRQCNDCYRLHRRNYYRKRHDGLKRDKPKPTISVLPKYEYVFVHQDGREIKVNNRIVFTRKAGLTIYETIKIVKGLKPQKGWQLLSYKELLDKKRGIYEQFTFPKIRT